MVNQMFLNTEPVDEITQNENYNVGGGSNYNATADNYLDIRDLLIRIAKDYIQKSGVHNRIESEIAGNDFEVQYNINNYYTKKELNDKTGGTLIGYDDNLQQPQVGATNVQEAIDGIKDVALEGNLTDINVTLTTPS